MTQTKINDDRMSNQLIPQPPALRDGIARCLAKPRHGEALLLFTKRRGVGLRPLSSQERGVGGEFRIMAGL